MALFYKQVVPLERQTHARLKVRPPENFAFTAAASLVPLLTPEFAQVAREYPIVFLRDSETQSFVPVALIGMPQGKNLFLNEAGKWDARYIPAYVRRYPFAFVETGADKFTLCVDSTSACLSETEGVALFGANGEPTNTLQETIKALSEYQRAMVATKSFVDRVVAADILMEAHAKADLPDGRTFQWSGFSVVDEKKFRELPAATLQEWFKSGELGLLYAHLLSVGNLTELLRRSGPAPAAPAQAS